MQPGEREVFDQMLEELFGALDKPLTDAKREGFWRSLERMSLVEFARCRDQLLRELEDGEPRKTFSVQDVWSAKRRLRSPGHSRVESNEAPEWAGDHWDDKANRLLLHHLTNAIPKRAKRYGTGEIRIVDGALRAVPSDAMAERVAVLVAAKNTWALEMRESQVFSAEYAESFWREQIAAAEAQIERMSAETEASEAA